MPEVTTAAPSTKTARTTKTLTIRDALNSALEEALRTDERVFLLGEDLADPGGGIQMVTAGLSTAYGTDRVMNTPISEAAIVGAAVGASLEGMLPVAEIMIMDFISIAMDQIVNHAAKTRYMTAGRTTCPLTVRTTVFEGTGSGATHAQTLEAWFMHVPGIKVVYPSTPADAKGLLLSSIFDPDPVLVIEAASLYGRRGPVPQGDGFRVPSGKAAVPRAGEHLSIITYGPAVPQALDAAKTLSAEGIEAEVVDLRSLLPLDMETVLASVAKTRRAVVAHHATTFAGPGAEVSAQITESLFHELEEPVTRVGPAFRPIAATQSEAATILGTDDIVAAARKTMGKAHD
jgi:pyruvate dehydrogenase E1 component beta subunit